MPVAANVTVEPITASWTAVPCPRLTLEPVRALKMFVPTPAPSDTLPLMVPALVNTFPVCPPASNASRPWKATRPVMVPVFVMLTPGPFPMAEREFLT